MLGLGIDIGYSSVKTALVDEENRVVHSEYVLHKGRPLECLREMVGRIRSARSPRKIGCAVVTGGGAGILSDKAGLPSVNEVSALTEGARLLCPGCRSIIEIGGQGARYVSGLDKLSELEISMSSGCAAGTGSFLEEQASRLNLSLEGYSVYASRAQSVPRIAGRCSVFAKTDVTHLMQEGVPADEILLGLAYSVVRNYRGSVMKRLPKSAPFALLGGVAKNAGVRIALKDILNLTDRDLFLPSCPGCAAAAGAAAEALRERAEFDFDAFSQEIETLEYQTEKISRLRSLSLFGNHDGVDKHEGPASCLPSGQSYFLGIDVGSTSTNTVLVNGDGAVECCEYVRTYGDPLEAVETAFRQTAERFGREPEIRGVGITGSGRHRIGRHISADLIKDEISAQARAAAHIYPEADTVFEIGGQDSKYIRLEEGRVKDFQMNKVCAAGTGSFIEEQALKFDIPVGELGDLALASLTPLDLGERCTVFIESAIASHLARGASLEDIAAGLCYSIVRNYLNRVVGSRKLGDTILLQGGIAFNQGIVNAFRSVTGKRIIVPPFFSVTGAYGAALCARDEMGGKETGFKGFSARTGDDSPHDEREKDSEGKSMERYNQRIMELFFKDYRPDLDPDKKTVGIPRTIFAYGMFPMFNAFFLSLGFNVLLSHPGDERTVETGLDHSSDEICFPLKLITGHVMELADLGVDYIFFPDLFTVDNPRSKSRRNYGCPYMQTACRMLEQSVSRKSPKTELLSPSMAFSRGKPFMQRNFLELGRRLGRSGEEIQRALEQAQKAVKLFEQRLGNNGREIMEKLDPHKITFVLISKIYGVMDPVLNMGLPGMLMNRGYQVLTFNELPGGDLSSEHPNMFWPFGMSILEPAKLIREHPNMHAVLLTHHGCGPDSVLSHFFSELMEDKPYLNLEVDEHSSAVGVITRIEAFINSVGKPAAAEASVEQYRKRIRHRKDRCLTSLSSEERKRTIILPPLPPYDELLKALLIRWGVKVELASPADAAALSEGRQYIRTNEYLSLTALLGSFFSFLKKHPDLDRPVLALPQFEGAESEGQYARLLRAKLDENGAESVEVFSPFLEDLIHLEQDAVLALFSVLFLGDLLLLYPHERRASVKKELVERIGAAAPSFSMVEDFADGLRRDIDTGNGGLRVSVMGEVWVLYNESLNGGCLKRLEEQGVRIRYAPLSECLWFFWSDNQHGGPCHPVLDSSLEIVAKQMRFLSTFLSSESPYTAEPDSLKPAADKGLGLYAGAFGRYRAARELSESSTADGIIRLSSAYENTGTALDILGRGQSMKHSTPVLNLVFDGTENGNDRARLESFIYLLKKKESRCTVKVTGDREAPAVTGCKIQ